MIENAKTRGTLYVIGMVVCVLLAVLTIIFGFVTKEQLFAVILLAGELFAGFLTLLARLNVEK
jgi:hypothetical protein